MAGILGALVRGEGGYRPVAILDFVVDDGQPHAVVTDADGRVGVVPLGGLELMEPEPLRVIERVMQEAVTRDR